MGKQRANTNPPHCPSAQHPHLRGSGRPRERNLLLWTDTQLWGHSAAATVTHQLPEPRLLLCFLHPRAGRGQPRVSSSAWTSCSSAGAPGELFCMASFPDPHPACFNPMETHAPLSGMVHTRQTSVLFTSGPDNSNFPTTFSSKLDSISEVS